MHQPKIHQLLKNNKKSSIHFSGNFKGLEKKNERLLQEPTYK